MTTEKAEPFLTRSHIFTIAFFAVLLFLLYQMGRMLAPFSAAILWAGVIALWVHPLYRRLVLLLRGREGLAAIIMTLFTLLIVIGPTIMLLSVLVSQTVELYDWVAEGIKSGALIDFWNRISSVISRKLLALPFLADLDIKEIVTNGLRRFSSSMAAQVGALLRDTLFLFLHLLIMLTALFFFLRNGERYYRTAVDLIPFSKEQKQSITRKLHDTFTAVINGVFLVALGQGLMTGLGFAMFGISFAVFWGFTATILALLPFGGAAVVWIPGALYLFFTGAMLQAILLTVWGIIISTSDNFIRPMLIGKKAQLSTFFLFFGILGGIHVYGFLGILFGPLIVTLLTAFIQIYREEFASTEKI